MWRALGFILNPVGSLLWPVFRWMGRGIDRMLGPVVGFYFAALLALLCAASLVAGLYGMSDHLARATGLAPPLEVAEVTGIVRSVEVLSKKTTSTREKLTITYSDAGGTHSFVENVTAFLGDEHDAGDAITVYLTPEGKPSLEDPNDAFTTVFFALIGSAVPLFFFVVSIVYLRHRRRQYLARPQRPAPEVAPVAARGRQRVLTTAERLEADAVRVKTKTR